MISLLLLRSQYESLFASMKIRPEKLASVDAMVNKIIANKQAYVSAVAGTKVPWYFIGLINAMERSASLNYHLHNGDPLTKRTVNVPAGYPKAAPANGVSYTFVESARDAIKLKKLDQVIDWSIPHMLYLLESYNGWGYRKYHASVLTPYLWSFTTHYLQGKYVADGSWSSTAVSSQAGAAAILKRLSEKLPEVAGAIKVANEAYAASVKKKG